MSLTIFCLLSLGLYALLNFYFIPILEKKTSRDLSPNRIGKAALLGSLSVLKGVALIFFIASILIILFLLLSSLMGGNTTASISKAIDTIKGWKDSLSHFSTGWGIFSLIVLIGALVIHAYRRSKVKVKRLK